MCPNSLRGGSGWHRKIPRASGQPPSGGNKRPPIPCARRSKLSGRWPSPSCRTSCQELPMIISHQPRRLFRCRKFVPHSSLTAPAVSSDSSHLHGLRFFDPTHPTQPHPLKILTYLRPCSSRAFRIGTPRCRAEPYATQSEGGQRGGRRRNASGRVRRSRSRDFYDPGRNPRSAGSRARRACNIRGDLDVGPCPTHSGASTGRVAGGGKARATAPGGGQVAFFAIGWNVPDGVCACQFRVPKGLPCTIAFL